MRHAKIQLSPTEENLLSNADVILTKNRVLAKIKTLLERVEEAQLEHTAIFSNAHVFDMSPKISRGENYLGFIWYQSATLVPLALPLAVLLSSLMTFGNLGESYELVAIKSAGISLLRFMRPLFILTIGICGIAFLFSNNIMPVANLKSRTMLSDIYYAKPAFNIKEGTFYTATSDFAIKIGKKEQDSILHDVIIYERGGSSLQDNFVVAESAAM